jgi:hypothetical protein
MMGKIDEKKTSGLKAMKAVYSYFFPEVRKIVRESENIPYQIFLTSTTADEANRLLKASGFSIKAPQTLEGKVDLDMIHEPIIDKIVSSYSGLIKGLDGFKGRYPMAGSSQGIFHLLSELKQKGADTIYTFPGEYEGYKEYGKCIGLETKEIGYDIPAKEIPRGYWFISNPSARNGNIIPDGKIKELCDAGHKIILDLAYVGMTKQHEFDLRDENIIGAVMSMSKPYGVFRFRIGGFAFTREPMDSLYANKWFKDVPALLTASRLVEEIPPGSLHEKYSAVQHKIIDELKEKTGLPLRPSDSFLLANIPVNETEGLPEEKMKLIAPYRRGDSYRLCLTPYFEAHEKEKDEMIKVKP